VSDLEPKQKKRRLRWEMTPRRVPSHPYRDSALFYAALAGIVVLVTALTHGDMRKALILAPTLFVVATGYSWWRWREKQREQARQAADK
jgi:hypothetical protein